MLKTRSGITSVALWVASFLWVTTGQGHPEVCRLLLALALGSTVVAAADRNARQLSEVAALSYRAGAASRARGSRILAGDLPASPREGLH